MANNDSILMALQQYFDVKQIASEKMPIDYLVSDEENRIKFYTVVKSSNDAEWADRVKSLAQYLELPKTEKLNVIVFKSSEKKDLLLGMLCYWNFERLRFNKDIHWRSLSADSIGWLRMQLKARHTRIAFLPLDYIRVVKTIDLRAEGYYDARIVYLRRFYGEDYRMQEHTEVTQEERFDRLLNGTPQNEYPHDSLDDFILEEVRTIYPNASLKNKLLLFDVDLLNYRLEKENKKQIIELELQIAEGNKITTKSVPLECYYQLNPFKSYLMREKKLPVFVNTEQYHELCKLQSTYNTLSEINI